MLLLRLSQGISSGYHHTTPTQKNCHYCGQGDLSFCLDLPKVFPQGDTMPHLQQKQIYSKLVLICEWGIILRFRLSRGISSGCHPYTKKLSLLWAGCFILLLRFTQGISSGCHHVTPRPQKFRNCHYCMKRALCSCFDLARHFFMVPPCHPYTQLLRNCRYCGKGHYASVRLRQGISSGVTIQPLHPKKFGIVIIGGRGY